MTRLRVLCAAVALACASGQVLAATASHNAAAEKFLTLANADKLGTPVYMQVQQMFAQRFAQTKAPAAKQPVLASSQTFTEQELKDLVKFYESPLGKKVLREMPKVTQQSAQLTQQSLEPAVPVVNKLLEDMTKELDPNAGKAAVPAKK